MYNLGLIYFLIPFLTSSLIKNKIGLIFSILIGNEKYSVKFNNDVTLSFKASDYNELLHLIGILSYATSYEITSKRIQVSFDFSNIIEININELSRETKNLLELLFHATKHGANFISKSNTEQLRDKTLILDEIQSRKIVITSNGIKFFLDAIHPGNSIVETFIQDIHSVKQNLDLNNKIVLDVGGECGDTALYYAKQGAKVFSFEPMKNNFDDMIENLNLNPDLTKNVVPINAAIGKDEILKLYLNKDTPDIGASCYNKHGKNAKTIEVKSYSIESVLKEFKIPHVDLLKMDCKACEFFLTEKSLENIDQIKIEVSAAVTKEGKNIDELINVLKKSKFKISVYRSNPFLHMSNKIHCHIFGIKQIIN